ncbi:Os08g0528700 [Oryza sativa Japonica Group]|uniref:Os08g0528700 protein n=1 Tax=Oryza sativa subsp. japonica TaxID=39947 RepID=A0A0N7KQ67_ORYSJ|nr:hypothetical protein DAI22_08g223100 [Oryza sativa Japonica Group]BAT06370.1 Os08g0528700 [Oryza sativa Japonica Group]
MLRLQNHLLPLLRASSSSSPVHLRRLIPSTAAASSSSSVHPNRRLHSTAAARSTTTATPFSMEDYLVDTCGLTAAQALKASKNVSHLKSATKPDAVLAILSGVGLSGADLAAVFAAEPRLLCTKAPSVALRVASLRHRVGLSDPQIASLLLLPGGAKGFHTCDMAPRLEFWIPFLGSFEMLDLEEEQRDRQLEPREGYQAQHRAAPGVRAKVFVILSRCPRRPRGSSRSAQRD